MSRPLSLLIFLGAAVSALSPLAHGADTAYQALRVVGTARGQGVLNQVIEVRGLGGAPEPATWILLVDDPAARGGVREFEIAKGKIVSERTPVRPPGLGPVMNFQSLNLDSEGAFTVANQEANKSGVGFDYADYTLRGREGQGTPIWILELHARNRQLVGILHISADSGQIVRREGLLPATTGGRPTPPPPMPEDPDAAPGASPTPHKGVVGRTAHSIHKFILKGAASVQEAVTGDRTLDRRYDNEQ